MKSPMPPITGCTSTMSSTGRPPPASPIRGRGRRPMRIYFTAAACATALRTPPGFPRTQRSTSASSMRSSSPASGTFKASRFDIVNLFDKVYEEIQGRLGHRRIRSTIPGNGAGFSADFMRVLTHNPFLQSRDPDFPQTGQLQPGGLPINRPFLSGANV